MINKKVLLKNHYEVLKDSNAYIEIINYGKCLEYPKKYKRYPILIVAGGSYEFVSDREKWPSTFAFLSHGFACITLNYSCNNKYPFPQLEAACAMDFISKNAEKYGFDLSKKTMIGFSAGGHLVASYNLYYKELALLANLKEENIKADCQILAYPVITMGANTHQRSKEIITGNDNLLIEKLSIEKNIQNNYIPTFIWTTLDDTCVSPENSKMLDEALSLKNIKHQLIIYPNGNHGKSICTNETEQNKTILDECLLKMQDWVKEAVKFIYGL